VRTIENDHFWSERGHITCFQHTPYPGSDTWEWERWEAITAREREELEREIGKVKCEVCGE
jgi:hypothetical protein